MPILTSLLILLLGATSHALPGGHVPVFRAKHSPFASGELPIEELQKRRVNQSVEQWQLVSWNNNQFWIPAKEFLLPIQTSKKVRVTGHTLLLKSPYAFADPIQNLPAHQQALAVSFENDWVKILIPATKTKAATTGWVSAFFLESLDQDKGYLYTRYRSKLYQFPTGTAKSLVSIPFGTRIEPLEWNQEWVKAQFGRQIGYIPLNHFVGRAHFAKEAHYQGKWHLITKIQLPYLSLKGHSKPIAIQDIQGYRGADPREGLILTENLIGYSDPNLQSRKITLPPEVLAQRAKMIRYEFNTWYLSITSKHGPVWWTNSVTNKIKASLPNTKSTKDILQKNIYSLATHPGHEKQTLLSAEGVYFTQDGEIWQQISQFDNMNLPVAIGADGSLFVGDKWSKDWGDSFSAYIRWDKLTKEIAKKLKKPPESLKIERIEPQDKSVRVRINVGSEVLTAQGIPESDNWSIQ